MLQLLSQLLCSTWTVAAVAAVLFLVLVLVFQQYQSLAHFGLQDFGERPVWLIAGQHRLLGRGLKSQDRGAQSEQLLGVLHLRGLLWRRGGRHPIKPAG